MSKFIALNSKTENVQIIVNISEIKYVFPDKDGTAIIDIGTIKIYVCETFEHVASYLDLSQPH